MSRFKREGWKIYKTSSEYFFMDNKKVFQTQKCLITGKYKK